MNYRKLETGLTLLLMAGIVAVLVLAAVPDRPLPPALPVAVTRPAVSPALAETPVAGPVVLVLSHQQVTLSEDRQQLLVVLDMVMEGDAAHPGFTAPLHISGGIRPDMAAGVFYLANPVVAPADLAVLPPARQQVVAQLMPQALVDYFRTYPVFAPGRSLGTPPALRLALPAT